jgi:hypothetical protein
MIIEIIDLPARQQNRRHYATYQNDQEKSAER